MHAEVLVTPRGNSSVGRAQPCQGWGREFESRFPLQKITRNLLIVFYSLIVRESTAISSIASLTRLLFETKGAVTEWSCSGLQLRVRRFDSDPRLHFIFNKLQLFFKSYQKSPDKIFRKPDIFLV